MAQASRRPLHWVQRVATLDDLVAARDEIVADPGTDIDYDDMSEGREHLDDDDLLATHVDDTISGLRVLFADGTATLHRAISVDNVATFMATCASEPLGNHWTADRDCATTRLHGGEMRRHDILLSAHVRGDQICWAATMQQRICHPCEMEVFVTGAVRLMVVADMATGEIATPEVEATA